MSLGWNYGGYAAGAHKMGALVTVQLPRGTRDHRHPPIPTLQSSRPRVARPFCFYHFIIGWNCIVERVPFCCLWSLVCGLAVFICVGFCVGGWRGLVLGEHSSASNEIRYVSHLCFADANIAWYILHTYQSNVGLTWIWYRISSR